MIEFHLIALLLAVPAERKCPSPPAQMPGYEWRQPVFLVDGTIVPTPPEGGPDLEPDNIASIRIACWDPATDSFARDGIPVVRIQTKTLVEATRAPLLQLIRAQQDFRARHERYAADLASLAPFGLKADVDLEFEASESGWTASTPSGIVAHRCTANEASAGTLGEDGQPVLDCAPVDTLALHSLRARYDAGAGLPGNRSGGP